VVIELLDNCVPLRLLCNATERSSMADMERTLPVLEWPPPETEFGHSVALVMVGSGSCRLQLWWNTTQL
jgi:hypothetical protein